MIDGLVTRMRSRVRSFLVGTFTNWWRLYSSMISYYRPPSDKGTSLQQLELSLSRINHASNTNIILGGDFNLGHIDWSIPLSPRGGNIVWTLLMLDGLVTRMRSRVRSFLVGTFTNWWRLFSSMISKSLMLSSVNSKLIAR
jgi:hypothetical protein